MQARSAKIEPDRAPRCNQWQWEGPGKHPQPASVAAQLPLIDRPPPGAASVDLATEPIQQMVAGFDTIANEPGTQRRALSCRGQRPPGADVQGSIDLDVRKIDSR